MNDQLKHRLLGFIVLIALGVIFVPMMLDFSQDSENNTGSPIPAKPKEAFTTLTIPLQPKVEEASPQEPEPLPKVEPPDVKKPPELKITTPGTLDKPEVKKPAPTVTASLPNAWVVQLGSFSDKKNATALRDRLRKAGFAAFVEEVPGKKDTVRVRIGPELVRENADALKARLQKELKQKAVVMPYR